jgi:hypothetical protein
MPLQTKEPWFDVYYAHCDRKWSYLDRIVTTDDCSVCGAVIEPYYYEIDGEQKDTWDDGFEKFDKQMGWV